VRVREGITITGHVEPRQVCTVTYTPTERDAGGPLGTLLAPSVTTDDGEFSISPALPRPARLEARCPGGDRGGVEITPTPNGPAVVIQVTAGASIAGRVIDAKGKPLAGVQVMAAVDGNEREIFVVNGVVTSGAQTTANANGEYLITGLLPGPYRVTALDRGRPLRPLAPVRVTLAEKEKKTGVDVRVDRADGVITGRVTGADGKPIPDAWVSAHQSIQAMVSELARGGGDEKNVSVSTSVMTDDDGALTNDVAPVLTDAAGKFTIANLPHGEFVVIAEAQAGALRGRADKVQPDANIAIQALGMSSLSGTVRSATGPAAIFTLDLVGPTTASRTFTDGTFELGRVDAGAYTITVHSHDGNGEATVTVQPNTPATVAVQLAQNAVVIGKLVGADGKPLADTGVVLLADQGPGHLSVRLEGPPPTSGPDGSFRLEGPAVVSVLAVMLPQRPWSKRPLALEPGKTLDLGTLTVDSGPPPAP